MYEHIKDIHVCQLYPSPLPHTRPGCLGGHISGCRRQWGGEGVQGLHMTAAADHSAKYQDGGGWWVGVLSDDSNLLRKISTTYILFRPPTLSNNQFCCNNCRHLLSVLGGRCFNPVLHVSQIGLFYM
jgi:hypothetical protein